MGLKDRKTNILIILVLILCYWLSIFISNYTYCTDFPVFYCAASTILDPNTANEAVYERDSENKYNIPESRAAHFDFIYSMPVAYVMSPLALLPYYTAKAVMIFVNILMYLGAVAIALRLGGATGRGFAYPLALSFLWMPFIENLRFGQVNAIMLFLVSVAALAATKNRPALCGTLLGIAALFKLFPVAIAMVLGLKDWRIFVACALVLGASFLIPGSLEWLPAIGNVSPVGYSPVYLWLKEFGSLWFFCYAGGIAGITALVVHRAKKYSFPFLVSFTVPAMFLTMPIVEYYHLTLLMFSYAYLWGSSGKSNKLLMISMFISITMISSSIDISVPFLIINALFLIWVVLVFQQTFAVTKLSGGDLPPIFRRTNRIESI